MRSNASTSQELMKMCPWMSSLWWKWSHANSVYPDECVETDYSSAPGWSKYTILSVALKCTITLLFFSFFFVVGFLKGKGKKSLQFGQFSLGNGKGCHPDTIREEGFGTVNTFEKRSPTIACNLFFRTRFLDADDNKYPRIPQPGHSPDAAHVFTRGHKHILFGNRQETQTHETRVS